MIPALLGVLYTVPAMLLRVRWQTLQVTGEPNPWRTPTLSNSYRNFSTTGEPHRNLLSTLITKPMKKSEQYATKEQERIEPLRKPAGFWRPEAPGPKILTLDIETAPIRGHVWALFDQNLQINQIDKDWGILGFAAKWLDQDEVFYEDCFDQPEYNDLGVAYSLWYLMNEADIILGHNSKAFDTKKITARFLNLGFNPPKPYRHIDTKVAAAQVAKSTSNKLEYLSNVWTDSPKSKHMKFAGFELWREFLQGNREARDEMEMYNRQDVKTTELVYLRLRPWIQNHPNVAVYYDDDEMRCPKCGSIDLHEHGYMYTQVTKYQQYRCRKCGGYSRGRKMLSSKDKRANIISPV